MLRVTRMPAQPEPPGTAPPNPGSGLLWWGHCCGAWGTQPGPSLGVVTSSPVALPRNALPTLQLLDPRRGMSALPAWPQQSHSSTSPDSGSHQASSEGLPWLLDSALPAPLVEMNAPSRILPQRRRELVGQSWDTLGYASSICTWNSQGDAAPVAHHADLG